MVGDPVFLFRLKEVGCEVVCEFVSCVGIVIFRYCLLRFCVFHVCLGDICDWLFVMFVRIRLFWFRISVITQWLV